MLFATVLAPWLCGFIAAFYLTKNQFVEFLWFLLVVKAIVLCWTLCNLRNESPAVRKSFQYVVILYAGYLFLVWRGLTKAYEWTHLNLQTKGANGLALGLFDYAYVDIFINVIIVAVVTWAITTLFTKPTNIPHPD